MQDTLNAFYVFLSTRGVDILLTLLGAVALWIIGRWLIRFAVRVLVGSLERRRFDATITRYLTSALSVILTIGLIISIFGYLGVQTTTFAALLAGAGLAIGTAWGGLLTNFAAGMFMVVLRPFKVGDFVSAGGVTGTVAELGMFVTVINTPDNVRVTVGNNKVFSDNVHNYTANPYRRVELKAQLDHTGDYQQAIDLLRKRIEQIPNVVKTPAPELSILEFNLAGPVLAVRPYTHNDSYWQVAFDTNAAIREELGKAGFAVPQQHVQFVGPLAKAG